jgi:hypothetical protein
LDTRGGVGAHALFGFRRALGSTSGPLAQTLDLARLGEHEQREHRDPKQRREGHYRTHLGERVRDRQRQREGVHGDSYRHRGRAEVEQREFIDPGSL